MAGTRTLKQLIQAGVIAACAQIFIALSNMPVAFDDRKIIEPWLSMGYLSLLIVPLFLGGLQSRKIKLVNRQLSSVARMTNTTPCTDTDTKRTAHSSPTHTLHATTQPTTRPHPAFPLVGFPAFSGFLAGAGLSLLAVSIANFDLRDPLLNWSPQLLEILNFKRSVITAVFAWPIICSALAAASGMLQLVNKKIRRMVVAATVAVVGAAVLESLVVDIAQGLHIEPLISKLYAPRGGLHSAGLLIVVGATMILALNSQFHGLRLLRARLGRLITARRDHERRPSSISRHSSSSTPRHRDSSSTPRRGLRVLGSVASPSANTKRVAVALLILLVLPMLTGKLTNELLANIGLFALLALGLNIVVGLAGILDLGYVAFFAVGSYSMAVLTAASSPKVSPELPWLVALIVVVALTALLGLFIGTPVIRMRGDYLAIVTLGFGEIIRLLFLSDWLSGWFGGAQGITNVDGVELFGITTITGTDPRSVFYLVLVFCVLAVYVSWRLERSRVGRAWMAVREDETVAQIMGINTVNVKLLAFVVGAALGSFSGAIFVAKVGSVFPSSFHIIVSIVILVVVIFGGMGNIVGVIAGTVVLIGVLGGPRQPGLLQEFSEFKMLIYGALLVWLMIARPQGLIPKVHKTRRLQEEDVEQDAWLKASDSEVRSLSQATTAAAPPLTRTTPAKTPASTEPPLLETRALNVSFGGLRALKGLHITVREGEIVSVIGPNGAGKTTLFNAITAAVPASGGDILFNGCSLLGLDPNDITTLGIARTFQNVRLFGSMTIRENVMAAQHCRNPQSILGTLLCTPTFRRQEAEIRQRAERILRFFGPRLVGFRLDQPAESLSYANRRRLEIARALATQPKLLLLDEPVAGMNPAESAELAELIVEIREKWGVTIVVIEHDMMAVGAVSDRVIVLDHGGKIAQGSYSEVISNPHVIEAYLGEDYAVTNS